MSCLNVNSVTLAGRLTADPEIRSVVSGENTVKVATFTVAVNRPKQGDKEEADFHRVVAWRKKAELLEKFFHKGNAIFVVGELRSRTWDGDDGKKRFATEVLAKEIKFIDSKKDSGNYGEDYDHDSSSYGYDAPPAYANPPYAQYSESDFALLEGDDEQLPF